MEVYVYILESLRSGRLYIGITKDTSQRLLEHNRGKSKFTKGHIPWKLVYFEGHEDYESARKREKYLKSGGGRRWIKENISLG